MRQHIGFLPENVAFQQAMSGRDVLRFYLRLKRRPAAEADALLARVGLEKAARKRVGTYSKGMRQRLGLAQALIGSPKVLLLDEPTSGLDPELRAQFYDMVQALKDAGTTILLSSHALTELEARTDRVAIMNQGRLVACAALAELRHAAGLPTRILVSVPPGTGADLPARVGANVEVAHVNDRSVELTCAPDVKMEVLRGLSALGHDVKDLEIAPPTLEQVYTHFLRREDSV
ncbi:MAG: ABC transporter ATP-binding protein [bacterium]|nr:ABC transporter ATP-binding protein [bacterium]